MHQAVSVCTGTSSCFLRSPSTTYNDYPSQPKHCCHEDQQSRNTTSKRQYGSPQLPPSNFQYGDLRQVTEHQQTRSATTLFMRRSWVGIKCNLASTGVPCMCHVHSRSCAQQNHEIQAAPALAGTIINTLAAEPLACCHNVVTTCRHKQPHGAS